MTKYPLLFCFLLSIGLSAQALRMEYFTVNDGLSTRDINDLHIGQDGFLWVSTMDGLNRFDGQGYKVFGQGPAEEGGLSRGGVASVTPDNEGKFIVKFRDFYGYFDRFDPQDHQVEQVRMVPSTGVVGYPRELTTDALGRTFVVTIGEEGTYLYEYTPQEDSIFTVVYHSAEDDWQKLTPEVRLLALSNTNFLLYDEEYGFRHLSSNGELLSRPFGDDFASRRFYDFAEGADGRVYLSFRSGPPLYRWAPERRRPPIAVENLDYGLVYPRIFKDKRGQLLLSATEDILGNQFPEEYYLIDTTGKVTLLDEPLPVDRKVTAITALDFRETVYLGLREGLGVVERYVSPVSTYLDTEVDNPLIRNNMAGIAEDSDGRVYCMVTEGAVYSFATGEDDLDTLQLWLAEDPDQLLEFRGGGDLVYEREANALWGTAQPRGEGRQAKGGLLFRYDLGARTTEVFRSPYALGALAFTEDGLFVAASDPTEVGLLLYFDPGSKSFVTAILDAETKEQVKGFRINTLAGTGSRELLLGTENRGLLGYDFRNTYLSDPYPFRAATDEAEGGTPVPIHVIHLGGDGEQWWVGTEKGLYRYDITTGESAHYGRSEGMSNSIVYGIVPVTDTTGGFWLSTQNGLTRMPGNPEEGSFRRYFREDGLSNDQFLPFAYHRATDGRYFFGGVNGLTVFREEDLSASNAGADVMLTEIEISGRESERVFAEDLGKLRQVTLFASEKSVAISFALPAGQLPSSSKFRYQLEGFNEGWQNLTNERTIRFNNLASGNYLLRIQGAGANGNFGDQETQLRINVRQFVIEKVWFQVLVLATFAGLLLYIIQRQLRERLRNEKLRVQLSSDIHDEVSGLLAGITLQAELLKNRTEDDKLKDRLDRVGQAGRSAMSKMSDVIWSIDSRRDTIGNLLQRMQEHADEVLLPIDIRYDFRAYGFDQDKELAGNIRQDVYFIFKEAINNIARHSNATRVEIEMTQAAQVFELFIRDNGRPQPAQNGAPSSHGTRVRAPKSGQGNDNMRMRAERLGGEISIDERRGYTVVFRMKRLG